MRTIAIINQKGGVGKSTIAMALKDGLIKRGHKVLIIDLDAQGNLSYTMNETITEYNALRILQNPDTITEEIRHTNKGDIVPGSSALAGADAIITEVGKEYRLKEALEQVKNNYDYCIIDTPPALGILTVNALTACNGVIIPAQADIYSLQGIAQLNNTIETVKRYCNNSLFIIGIILTRYNSRAVISKDITQLIEQTAHSLNTKVFKTKIRECTAIKEAQATKANIFDYSSRSNAVVDFNSFIDEFLKTKYLKEK